LDINNVNFGRISVGNRKSWFVLNTRLNF
jgi:hypothetical protein